MAGHREYHPAMPADRSNELRSIARRAMLERGLEPDFSAAAVEQVRGLGRGALESGPQLRDLRALLWCSIDNDDSRDLDQLSVAEPLSGGAVRVLVATADVDATVARGSPTDAHARPNTSTAYTAPQILPTLPERPTTALPSPADA